MICKGTQLNAEPGRPWLRRVPAGPARTKRLLIRGGAGPDSRCFAERVNRSSVEGVQPIAALRDLDLLYVTDRAPTSDPRTKAISYGSERSRTTSFGSIDIRIGPDSTGATEGMKLDESPRSGVFPKFLIRP
jgi:hypothetical protein